MAKSLLRLSLPRVCCALLLLIGALPVPVLAQATLTGLALNQPVPSEIDEGYRAGQNVTLTVSGSVPPGGSSTPLWLAAGAHPNQSDLGVGAVLDGPRGRCSLESPTGPDLLLVDAGWHTTSGAAVAVDLPGDPRPADPPRTTRYASQVTFAFGFVCDDNVVEPVEVFTVSLWTSATAPTMGEPPALTLSVLINDDDSITPLAPPTSVVVTSVSTTELSVSWTPPVPPPDRYHVSYRSATTRWTLVGTPTAPPAPISGLEEGRAYTVRVCSQNADGTPDPPTACATGQGGTDASDALEYRLSASPSVLSELDAGAGRSSPPLSITLTASAPVPEDTSFSIGVPTGADEGDAGSSATPGEDFLPVTPVTLVVSAGDTAGSVRLQVDVLADTAVEGPETFVVAALDAANEPRVDVAPVTIMITDLPDLVLGQPAARVPEPSAGLEQTGTLWLSIENPDPRRDFDVRLTIATVPYGAGDAEFAPATLCTDCPDADVRPIPEMSRDPAAPGRGGGWSYATTVRAGSTSASFAVGIIVGDGVPEPVEQFYVSVELDGYPRTRKRGLVEILERYERSDATGSVSVSFPGLPPGEYRLPEDGTTYVYVELTDRLVAAETLRFELRTLDGSARAGVDYRALSAELVFDRGRRRFVLPQDQVLAGIPNRFPEGDRSFFLQVFAYFPHNSTAYHVDMLTVTLVDNDAVEGATGERTTENLWVGPAVTAEHAEDACLLRDTEAPPIYVQEPAGYGHTVFELPLAAALTTETACAGINQAFEVDVFLRQSSDTRAARVGAGHDVSFTQARDAGPYRVLFESAGHRPVVRITVHGDPAVEPEEFVDVVVSKGVHGRNIYPLRIVDYQAEQQLLDAREATLTRAGRMLGGLIGDALADRFSCAASPGCGADTGVRDTGWIPGSPQRRPPGASWRSLAHRGLSLLRAFGGPWGAAADFTGGALRNGALGGVSSLLPVSALPGVQHPSGNHARHSGSQALPHAPVGSPVLSDPGFVPAGMPASVGVPAPAMASGGSPGSVPGGYASLFDRFAATGYRPDLAAQLGGLSWSSRQQAPWPWPVRNAEPPSSRTVWLRSDYLRIGNAGGKAGLSDSTMVGLLGGVDYSLRRTHVLGGLAGVAQFQSRETWSDDLATLENTHGLGRLGRWIVFGPYWGWQPASRLRAWGSASRAFPFGRLQTRVLGPGGAVPTNPCPPVDAVPVEPATDDPLPEPEPDCHHPRNPGMTVIVAGSSGTVWEGSGVVVDVEADLFRVRVSVPPVDRHDALEGRVSASVLQVAPGYADLEAQRSSGSSAAERQRVGFRVALPVLGRASRFVVTTGVRRDTGPDIEQVYGTAAPWAVDVGLDLRRGLGRSRGNSVHLILRYQVATLAAELPVGGPIPRVYGLAASWRVGRAERRTGWRAELSQRFGAAGLNGLVSGSFVQSLAPTVLHRLQSAPVLEGRWGYAFTPDIELSGSVTRPFGVAPAGPFGFGPRVEGLLSAGW